MVGFLEVFKVIFKVKGLSQEVIECWGEDGTKVQEANDITSEHDTHGLMIISYLVCCRSMMEEWGEVGIYGEKCG